MTLFAICLNVIAKPDVIEMHKLNLDLIPVRVKTAILTILCKRGHIKDIHILKQLLNSKITVMDLSECEVTNDILSCLHTCKYLKKLDLSLRRRQSRSISSEALNALFLQLHHLRIIAIPHSKEVNDEVIKTICCNCKQLNELHIQYSSITDKALYYLKDLEELAVINILGTQVSDEGIEHLVSGGLSESLKEINIDKCPKITAYSINIITQKCPNITIFKCGSFGSNDVRLPTHTKNSRTKQVFWSV